MNNMLKRRYMELALSLARKGLGRTSPNPPVGAVIVKDNKIIGQGYHRKAGEPHAEVMAIAEAGISAKGATMYVTMEPCSHIGRTPPCTTAIIEAGIENVIIGCLDPNPKEDGAGRKVLIDAGIKVEVGLMEEECKELIEAYSKFITTGIPFVAIKWAMSLDGRIATETGRSRWISGAQAREFIHQLRNEYDVIAVGIGTILKDDPLLTCRIDGGRNPVRAIFDTRARTPLNSKIVKTSDEVKTVIFHSDRARREDIERLRGKNIETVNISGVEGGIDIAKVIKEVGRMGLTSILVEGGARVIGYIVGNALFDKVYITISPILIGGRKAPAPVINAGIKELTEALRIDKVRYLFKGDDIIISGYRQV